MTTHASKVDFVVKMGVLLNIIVSALHPGEGRYAINVSYLLFIRKFTIIKLCLSFIT